MKRVILIRHAKSAWDDPFADDHGRGLTERGRQSADAIGAWLATHGYHPDLILSSDATRTRQTVDGLLPHLTPTPEVRYVADLYHASPDVMLDALVQNQAQTVAMVAHNPGMALLARGLVELRPDHGRFHDYPTCATTVIDFEGEIAPHTGHCAAFVIPREILATRGMSSSEQK